MTWNGSTLIVLQLILLKKITYIFINAKLFSNSHNFKKCNVVLHLECFVTFHHM